MGFAAFDAQSHAVLLISNVEVDVDPEERERYSANSLTEPLALAKVKASSCAKYK